jgi:hypothetical protein
MPSRWVVNGCPDKCAGCNRSFPQRENRIEAKIGYDGKLYCYGTPCEGDALELAILQIKRVS